MTDFKEINPELGDWEDIGNLGKQYDLMFDAVINHVSKSSRYFKEYAAGNPHYRGFFIEADPDGDYSTVIRPLSLIHIFNRPSGMLCTKPKVSSI